MYLPWLFIAIGGTIALVKIYYVQNQLRVQQAITASTLSKRVNADREQLRVQQSVTSSILSKKQKTDKESKITKLVVLSKISKTEEDLKALGSKTEYGLNSLKSAVSNQAILKRCVSEYRIYEHLKELVHILVTDNAHSGSNLLAKQGRDTLHVFYEELLNAQTSLRCQDRKIL
jgi:hypothetical protein